VHHSKNCALMSQMGPTTDFDRCPRRFRYIRRIVRQSLLAGVYISGIGMISTISIHVPGICRCGWSLPNIFVAASCDSACTIE
jgi:hypothetical protein